MPDTYDFCHFFAFGCFIAVWYFTVFPLTVVFLIVSVSLREPAVSFEIPPFFFWIEFIWLFDVLLELLLLVTEMSFELSVFQ